MAYKYGRRAARIMRARSRAPLAKLAPLKSCLRRGLRMGDLIIHWRKGMPLTQSVPYAVAELFFYDAPCGRVESRETSQYPERVTCPVCQAHLVEVRLVQVVNP